jgi:hypothetical protein
MKNISLPFMLALLLIGTITLSCDKEANLKPEGSLSPIVETELPDHGNVGEEINFIVSHAVFNGCGYYSSQRTTRIGNTLTVSFYAEYREGFCTMNIPILKTNYEFKPTKAGTYTFKFNAGEAGYLTRTIVIN